MVALFDYLAARPVLPNATHDCALYLSLYLLCVAHTL
jgi:hypothetical protein